MASGSLTFLDLSSAHFSPDQDSSDLSLRPIFDQIHGIMNEGEDCLVIVDDLSTLEWIGTPGLEVARFARALCALCRKVRSRFYIITKLRLACIIYQAERPTDCATPYHNPGRTRRPPSATDATMYISHRRLPTIFREKRLR